MGDTRTFVRGIASADYRLRDLRAAQLRAPRVRGPEVVVDDGSVGHTHESRPGGTSWRLGPGDNPFLTQSLQVSLNELPPHQDNRGHGHQNEAAFYVLEGRGHDIHDGRRYDWESGDLVVAHPDSVHRRYNDADEPAVALVVKAKSLWMFLGLTEQGPTNQSPDEQDGRFGPAVDWSRTWTPGVKELAKVVRPGDTPWRWTPDGRTRTLSPPELRLFSLDLHLQDIPAGSRTSRHWHMADEVLYVLSGAGHSLHWEVRADIGEQYTARIAREPTRHDFEAGDLVYIPQNVVHQHMNGSETEPLRFLSARNRVFRLLGYDNVARFETAPECTGNEVTTE